MPDIGPEGVPLPLVLLIAVGGAAWGLVADRIGARWPAHEDGSVRPVDWRTLLVILFGAGSLALLLIRFDDPAALAIFGAYFVALTLLFATDLDQRLLPDVITLPAVPLALIVGILGWNPLVADQLPSALLAAVVFPAGLYALSIPFGAGAIGIGDLKLLVSVGLLAGLGRTLAGVLVGALLAGVVVLVLLALRRVTLRTYVPFGPFLIIGAAWGILLG